MVDIFDLTPEEFVEKIGTGTIVHNSGEITHMSYIFCPFMFSICASHAEVEFHPGDLFGDHLRAVQRVLREWNAGKELELAGLFHSIYGTEGFQVIALIRFTRFASLGRP